MTKHQATQKLDSFLTHVVGKLGTGLYRLLSIGLLALLCAIAKWYGPDMGHRFVAQTPEVVQAEADAVIAKSTAADAKVLAASVALDSKNSITAVSQEVATIVATMKQLHGDLATINTTMAVHGSNLQDIVNRLDRVERKQDASSHP